MSVDFPLLRHLRLVMVNLLELFGLPGAVVDGIPVQNQWLDSLRKALTDEKKQENSGTWLTTAAQIVKGQTDDFLGVPLPKFLEACSAGNGLWKMTCGTRSFVVVS